MFNKYSTSMYDERIKMITNSNPNKLIRFIIIYLIMILKLLIIVSIFHFVFN